MSSERPARNQFRSADFTSVRMLAMAEWRLGDREAARQWYAKGIDWMKAHPQIVAGNAHRFRAEAEQLLGIDTKTEPELVNQNVTEDPK